MSSLSQPIVVRVTIRFPSNHAAMTSPAPRVAVVSEDAELVDACARVLRQEGYAVRTASHSGHALLACMEGQPIDILIAELSMSEGSGLALARRMRRYNPNLRAIFIAGKGAAAGGDVLVRPFTRDDLLQRLDSLPAGEVLEVTHSSAYF